MESEKDKWAKEKWRLNQKAQLLREYIIAWELPKAYRAALDLAVDIENVGLEEELQSQPSKQSGSSKGADTKRR